MSVPLVLVQGQRGGPIELGLRIECQGPDVNGIWFISQAMQRHQEFLYLRHLVDRMFVESLPLEMQVAIGAPIGVGAAPAGGTGAAPHGPPDATPKQMPRPRAWPSRAHPYDNPPQSQVGPGTGT